MFHFWIKGDLSNFRTNMWSVLLIEPLTRFDLSTVLKKADWRAKCDMNLSGTYPMAPSFHSHAHEPPSPCWKQETWLTPRNSMGAVSSALRAIVEDTAAAWQTSSGKVASLTICHGCLWHHTPVHNLLSSCAISILPTGASREIHDSQSLSISDSQNRAPSRWPCNKVYRPTYRTCCGKGLASDLSHLGLKTNQQDWGEKEWKIWLDLGFCLVVMAPWPRGLETKMATQIRESISFSRSPVLASSTGNRNTNFITPWSPTHTRIFKAFSLGKGPNLRPTNLRSLIFWQFRVISKMGSDNPNQKTRSGPKDVWHGAIYAFGQTLGWSEGL